MPIFDFSTPVKKNNKGKYKVIKEKYTIKVRKVKGIVFIDKDGSYKVLIEDNIIPIKQECFTCKGASNIYMQELEKKSIRNIYIRYDNLNQELDILYYLPFCVGCIVKGNIVVNNYDKQQYFDIKESYIEILKISYFFASLHISIIISDAFSMLFTGTYSYTPWKL